MKISSGNKQSRSGHHPSSTIHHPRYALTKHIAFWHLTFNGQKACFDHEQGAYYVAYLLLNPPDEPIHGMALELKAMAYFQRAPGVACNTFITDPATGQTLTLGCYAAVVERNLCIDEAEGLAYIRRKEEELEAILESETASEPVKVEVQQELEELYAWQKENHFQVTDEAQKVVRTVRMAIQRFHRGLASAVDPQGRPHQILRPFADHIEKYMLIPSARYTNAGRGRTKTGVAGCFTYEPPHGVIWTA